MSSALVPVGAWTQFWDMHSGGGQKLDWAKIYIEAPEPKAISIFQSRFGRHPWNVTCRCCGSDYSLSEYKTLAEATAFHRNARINPDGSETREKHLDTYIMEYVRRNPKEFPKKVQDLYRMAKDKSSPNEAAIAMDKLASMDMYPWWSAKPLISVEDYLKKDALAIYAKDLTPAELALPEDTSDYWDF